MKLVVPTPYRHGIVADCLPVLLESAKCFVARLIVSRGSAPSRARRLRRKAAKAMQIGPLGALNGIRMRASYDSPPTPEVVVLCGRLGVPVFEMDRTNSDETVRLMREAGADLGLSLGNSYIAERVFSIPKLGMINIHAEQLPECQNALGVIQRIYNIEAKTGLTVHQIDRSIDTGCILYREEYPILFHAHLEDTVRAITETTRQHTPGAVRHVCENYERLIADAIPRETGRKYTAPTIWQFIRITRNDRRLYSKFGR